MIGINDVWNMCIIKCVKNRELIGILLLKWDNSGLNELTHNYGELRDVDA